MSYRRLSHRIRSAESGMQMRNEAVDGRVSLMIQQANSVVWTPHGAETPSTGNFHSSRDA